jgi:PilZ domain
MEERRTKPRQRILKAGTIEFDGGSIDCTIRNLSTMGAALDVASPVGIPSNITLNIVSSQERQHCHIVWRKEKRIGVIFANQDWQEMS